MGLMNSVQSVLSVILIISLGYFLSCKNWFDGSNAKLISKMVVNVSLPSYMISNITATYDRNKLFELGKGVLVPFTVMAVCYFVGGLLVKLLKIGKGRRGVFKAAFALSNTIFVGLPVNLALFGDDSIPYVLLYYIGNTVMFWTIGVYGISADAGNNDGKSSAENSSRNILTMTNIKRIFSPPLLGFVAAVLLVLAGISLPKSIADACKYVGNLTTPLSMIFIGIVFSSVKIKEIKFESSYLAVALGRFLISPALVFLIAMFFPMPALMKSVFVIQAAMPAMTQIPIVAALYGADERYATLVTIITTVISLVSIPVFMLLL